MFVPPEESDERCDPPEVQAGGGEEAGGGGGESHQGGEGRGAGSEQGGTLVSTSKGISIANIFRTFSDEQLSWNRCRRFYQGRVGGI